MAKEKFAAHRVLDRVGYGIGVRLQLTASQIADRRHALTVEDDKAGIVTVSEPIEFRAGEEIGITHALTRHEETALEAIDKAAAKKARSSSVPTVPAPTNGAGSDVGDSEGAPETDKQDADGVDAADEDDGADSEEGEEEKDKGDAGGE